MKLKYETVKVEGLHRAMWQAAGVMDLLHHDYSGGKELQITNAVAGRGYNSLHPRGRAFDCSVWDIGDDKRFDFVQECRLKLEPLGFRIVHEPDDLSDDTLTRQGRKREEVTEHFHVDLRDENAWLMAILRGRGQGDFEHKEIT